MTHQLTFPELTDVLHGRYNSKVEEQWVEWCAERIANDFIHEHPDCVPAGATVDDLKAEALADPTFTAKARARYRYETLDATKERSHG